MSSDRQWHDGELAARISTTVVRALARTTGRGPTKAKTTLGDNGIFVVLQDSLTRGEQTLVDAGEGEAVLDLRRRWQRVMQTELSREIEELTGRKVIGFMSDNHIDPDIAVEVFVLEPPAGDASVTMAMTELARSAHHATAPAARLGASRRRTPSRSLVSGQIRASESLAARARGGQR